MKKKIIAGIVLLLLGIGFIVASFQFAPLAHGAPTGGAGPSILEFVYGLPAVVFVCAGVAACVVAAFVVAVEFISSGD